MRILVIEDEKKTAAFLAKGLCEAGFVVDLARDGEAGLKRARGQFRSSHRRCHAAKQERLGGSRGTAARRGSHAHSFSYCPRQCARPGERTRVGRRRLFGEAVRVPRIAGPCALIVATRSSATQRTPTRRRFGNRPAAAQGSSLWRAAQSHAERVSPPCPSGSRAGRGGVAH